MRGAYLRVCWNRQTGKLEVLVFEWTCGFKSHHSHHPLIKAKIIENGIDKYNNFGYNQLCCLREWWNWQTR